MCIRDSPWILDAVHTLKKRKISADSVTKTESWSTEELGSSTKYHEIIIFCSERYCRNLFNIWCKFHVSFIDHNKDIMLFAMSKDFRNLVGIQCTGCWIVRITDVYKRQVLSYDKPAIIATIILLGLCVIACKLETFKAFTIKKRLIAILITVIAVSYTHLDVYKRQILERMSKTSLYQSLKML